MLSQTTVTKEILDRVFDSLHDALFIIDIKTVAVLECNPSALEIFGFTYDEIVGKTTEHLHVNESMCGEFRRILDNAVQEKGCLSNFEFRMKRKNGTIFPTEHTVFPIHNGKKEQIGWGSLVRDITERKKCRRRS